MGDGMDIGFSDYIFYNIDQVHEHRGEKKSGQIFFSVPRIFEAFHKQVQKYRRDKPSRPMQPSRKAQFVAEESMDMVYAHEDETYNFQLKSGQFFHSISLKTFRGGFRRLCLTLSKILFMRQEKFYKGEMWREDRKTSKDLARAGERLTSLYVG